MLRYLAWSAAVSGNLNRKQRDSGSNTESRRDALRAGRIAAGTAQLLYARLERIKHRCMRSSDISNMNLQSSDPSS